MCPSEREATTNLNDEVVIDLRRGGGEQRSSPIVAKRELLLRLVAARRAHYANRDQAAEACGWSTDKQRFLETGRTLPSDDDIDVLDRALDLPESEASTWRGLVSAAKQRSWWDEYSELVMGPDSRRYIGLEWGASSIRTYEALVVHGVMQTEAYAEAVIRGSGAASRPAELVARLLEVRRRRWSLLTSANPPEVSAVVDEAALHRAMGPPQVMKDQLRHLADLADLPHVAVRVIPFAAGPHAGLSGPFSLVGFERADATIVYVEGAGQVTFLEGERDVLRYSQTFDRLMDRALGISESQDMLRSVATSFGD